MNFSPGLTSLEAIQHFGLKSFEVGVMLKSPKCNKNPTSAAPRELLPLGQHENTA